MSALSRSARAEIRESGLTIVGYVRHHMGGDTWCGDRCGCSDNRCIGYHHDGSDDCGCLPVLIGMALAARPTT